MTRPRIVPLLSVAAALVVSGVVAPLARQAQTPGGGAAPQPPQPPVTFRVEVNYVEIDAVVTDAEGRPVRDLTKDDFRLAEAGKPQTLSQVTLVDLPVERPDAPLYSGTPIEPDVRSNEREFDGRIFVLVLDDLHTHFARTSRVREAARLFVERYLGANDLAAVVSTGSGRGTSQEFTGSRRLLLRAVDSFAGKKIRSATLDKVDDYYLQQAVGSGQPPRDTNEMERAYHARSAMQTLASVSSYLAGVRGRSKAILYFSEGLDYDISNMIDNRSASDVLSEMQNVIAAATRANVSVYGIDPRGLGGNTDELVDIASLPGDPSVGLGAASLNRELRNAQDSLRLVSDETGGFAAVNRNDFSEAFRRIVADNSTYYLLGYYSDDTRRDGRFRKVEVSVTRPGLTVRARKGYTAPKGKAPSPTEFAKDTSAPLRDALSSPIPVSGLPMRVFAAPLKGESGKGSVLVTVEIPGRSLAFASEQGRFAEDVEVSLLAVDQSGKARDGARDTLELRLKPETHAVVARSGLRYAKRLTLAPGRYQLRVGARESGAGRLGTVLYDLEVPDYGDADLAMSGLLLTSRSAGEMPSMNPDPELRQLLPAPPVAVREFPRGDVLALYTEIYDANQRTPHRVAMTTTVTSDAGRVLFTESDERSSAELKGGGAYGYAATVPLAEMPAGRYVLKVEARSLLNDGGAVSREVEFTIR